jgi:DNA-binding NarL/FixJ family response regulator
MPTVRLAIVEDDPDIRSLVHHYLSQQPDLNCVIVADSVEDLLQQLPDALPPHVILLDINLPGMSGIEALPILTARLPDVDVLMHTIFEDPDNIYQALCRGASGYVLKNTPLPQLAAAIQEVHAGGAPMSRAVARRVLAHFKPTPSRQPNTLSAREQEVLDAIVDGRSDKQIGVRLGLSPETVRTHVKRIYRKLHVTAGRAELMSRAARGEL